MCVWKSNRGHSHGLICNSGKNYHAINFQCSGGLISSINNALPKGGLIHLSLHFVLIFELDAKEPLLQSTIFLP